MLKSHEKIYSAHGKRLILIADDEALNREILRMTLEDDYELIFAADGQETIDQARRYRENLSLILLDLMMPVKPGLVALKEMREDPELHSIPVIVLTADQNAEVESLELGANDYIPKPYPRAEIIKARINRAIELFEDRNIIQSTERDPLTGLYSSEFFYRYAEQLDRHHRDTEMDAIVVNINHFHMINERFGSDYGDEVLRRVGDKLRDVLSDENGIVGRREADTFMAYCPHGRDYQAVLELVAAAADEDGKGGGRIRLRMGVYADADKSMDMQRRFDRAKMAADTVRNSFSDAVGIYDSAMHEKELYAEQLIDDFQTAIDEKQFKVYFQPKFDVRPKEPVLTSAEALVRWQHPKLGMVSPGAFIPLFEENGLIQPLDSYVWRETAAQIREWKDRIGFSVPVSVNVSRVDIFDPDLLAKFDDILKEYGLTSQDLMLEITESAYTKDSDRIIQTVSSLRDMGFMVEMDDFGTGYSSLNMISELPIDALKLDMMFVRSAFRDQKDTRMLEVIIDIAGHLGVPVIAEGVETGEQLAALKDLGCDIVQGYYFSKPIPAEEFEKFLEVRKTVSADRLVPETAGDSAAESGAGAAAGRTVAGQGAASAQTHGAKPIRLKMVNYIFVIVAVILAAALAYLDGQINACSLRMEDANARYAAAELAADDLMAGSDYLTDRVRAYAVTGEQEYLQNYFEEAQVTRRRDLALEKIRELTEGTDSRAYEDLTEALSYSNELMDLEYAAMRLTQLAFGYPDNAVPAEVSSVALDASEAAAEPEAQKTLARTLVFGSEYQSYKEMISSWVSVCTEELINDLSREAAYNRDALNRLLTIQTLLTILMLADVLFEVLFITFQISVPMAKLVGSMRAQEEAKPAGAAELRFVTQTYNEILAENKKTDSQVTYEVFHDTLTGLRNRRYYEMFMANVDLSRVGMIDLKVDSFRDLSDRLGAETGDRILKRVAEQLKQGFRSVDAVCRFGGEEFVVVMARADSSMTETAVGKIRQMNEILQKETDGLPAVTVSAGLAFADRENPKGDLMTDAATALREAKSTGRGCVKIYGGGLERLAE